MQMLQSAMLPPTLPSLGTPYWNVSALNRAEGEQPMGWYMPPG
ncbi:MAG: hypothetical protein ACYCW6_05500 [Candidatus Xenobia bacterium]